VIRPTWSLRSIRRRCCAAEWAGSRCLRRPAG